MQRLFHYILIHKIQDYFYDYSTSDIDIFITANTRFEAFKSIEFLYNQITNKLILEMSRNSKYFNDISNDDSFNYTLINNLYR